MYFEPKGSLAERKAFMRKIRDLSPTASRMNFAPMDVGTFSAVEGIVLHEARSRAANSGRLFKTSYRDDAGRKVSEFEGDIAAAFSTFMAPGYTARINTNAGTHEETVRVRDGQRLQVMG